MSAVPTAPSSVNIRSGVSFLLMPFHPLRCLNTPTHLYLKSIRVFWGFSWVTNFFLPLVTSWLPQLLHLIHILIFRGSSIYLFFLVHHTHITFLKLPLCYHIRNQNDTHFIPWLPTFGILLGTTFYNILQHTICLHHCTDISLYIPDAFRNSIPLPDFAGR